MKIMSPTKSAAVVFVCTLAQTYIGYQHECHGHIPRLQHGPAASFAPGFFPGMPDRPCIASWLLSWEVTSPPRNACLCQHTRNKIYLHVNPLTICMLIFTHLKLWLATASHNFKWVKISHIRFNLRPNICYSWCLGTHFIHNNCDLIPNKTESKRQHSCLVVKGSNRYLCIVLLEPKCLYQVPDIHFSYQQGY